MRLKNDGRVCKTKQNPKLSESFGVDTAGIWDESYCSYPGRPDTNPSRVYFGGNPCSDV
jgi:hypothetical protein